MVDDRMPANGGELGNQLRQLSTLIDRTYTDLAALRHPSLGANVLPEATDELNAIVRDTGSATSKIMDAADIFMQLANDMPAAQGQTAIAAATSVYEACAFQDITGQRVTKIIGLLQTLSDRIHQIVADLSGEASLSSQAIATSPSRKETKVDDPDAALLNGPALPGQGKTQDEVDALFSGRDA